MLFYNGYSDESLTEAEVKNLKVAKLTVREDSYSGGKVIIKSMNVYPHIPSGECHCYKCEARTLFSIATIIKQTWDKVWFGAVPYLRNMAYLESVDSEVDAGYGPIGKMDVLYFLSNAAQYKGTIAKHIKLELKHYCHLK